MLITSFHYDYYLRLRERLMDDNTTTEELAYYLAEVYVLLNTYNHPDSLFSDGNYVQGDMSVQRQYLINEFRGI